MRFSTARRLQMNESSWGDTVDVGPIDIVVPWVDSNDPAWRARFNAHMPGSASRSNDVGEERYRDWELLRYWFRGIDKFCPWARTVHFITEGHLPDWLDTEHPRLNIVKHTDYIPADCLPTFNANVIENNIHRIEGLADRFVYFNDDIYVTSKCSAAHFFPDGLPAGIATPSLPWNDDLLSHVSINASGLMNRLFNKRDVLKQHGRKWINARYGLRQNLQAVSLMPWKYITPFYIHHLPQAFDKSSFAAVWDAARIELEETNRSRFRRLSDLNQYVFYYWQLCSGRFNPVSPSHYGRLFQLGVDDINVIDSAVRGNEWPVICINDGPVTDIPAVMARLQESFNAILPATSSFEL